jgi:hypothetical protein
MSIKHVFALTQPQRDEFALVKLCVRFIVEMRRQVPVTDFDVRTAGASRNRFHHNYLASTNVDYDSKSESSDFGPKPQLFFKFRLELVASSLIKWHGFGELMGLKAWIPNDNALYPLLSKSKPVSRSTTFQNRVGLMGDI